MSEVVSIADKLAKAKAKLPQAPTVQQSIKEQNAYVPPVSFMQERNANDKIIDDLIDRIDVIEAYNTYAGKGAVENPGNKTEGIKVRCPNPAHIDMDPSAWINTEKQTWYCGGCAQGGDKFDIAAWHFGLPVPGYKDGAKFHELRRRIAESKGYVFQPTITGKTTVIPPISIKEIGPEGVTRESTPIVEPLEDDTSDEDTLADDLAPVIDINSDSISLEPDAEIELDWKHIVPEGTFLDTWMKATTIDDVPEEFHFWNGMLAIASACGRDVTLMDFRPVYANLFICFIGRTGSGKSKSKYLLDQLLEKALPYDATDPFSKGILRVAAPASAEALIWMFKKEVADPSLPTAKPLLYPVKGMVDFNELSGLVGRANRAGNVIIPTLMQFYDMERTIETVSRTHGTEKALEPFACAVTTSQPKALRGLLSLTDAASGFLNRWFFAAGKMKKRMAIGGVHVDVEPAVAPLQDIRVWANSAKQLQWSQEANDLFTQFFHNELEPIMKSDETDLLNRIDLFCKKLVLIYTANMKLKQVEVAAVEQMIRTYPYVLDCYGIPGATIGSSLQQDIRESIMKVVLDIQVKTGRGASNRDIQKRIKGKKYPLDLYNRTLKYMVEIEEIIVLPNLPGPGRPTTKYGVPDLEEAKEYLKYKTRTSSKATKTKAAKG